MPRTAPVLICLVMFLAPIAAQAAITVNFDSLDATAGPVTGSILNNYLAGFGISISNATSNTTPSVVHTGGPDTNANGLDGYASSAPNYFVGENSNNDPYSYRVNFAVPLTSFSFTRVAENGNGPSGLIVSPWDARALDSHGATVATVSEDQLAFYGTNVAAQFTLAGADIESVVFERTSFNAIAGLNAVLTDDWQLTPSVPEPTTLTLWCLGAAGMAICARRKAAA